MKRICTICARGGSKGVKNKNLKIILEKPLIAHSIIQAQNSNLFDTVAVSSDSSEILKVAKEYGVNVVIQRPDELASDTAAKPPVMKHCVVESEKITKIQYDTIVDIDATAPLRTVEDLINAVEKLESNTDAKNLITGMNARRSPYFNLVEESPNGYVDLSKKLDQSFIRRQDVPKAYDMNASIYVWKREAFFEGPKIFTDATLMYEMPEERSIDIDSPLDFEFVSFLAEKRGSLL